LKDSMTRDDLIRAAIVATRKGDYLRGLTVFADAYSPPLESKNAEGLSFYGLCLALVERKFKIAIDLCKKAIEMQFYHADHYANLARVYLAASNRKKAIEALEQGMKVLPQDELLILVRQELGVRSRPAVPFLSRDNPVNKALGRARHTKKKKPAPGATEESE
jgi:tetratricopeptide (TPR) repeat protein